MHIVRSLLRLAVACALATSALGCARTFGAFPAPEVCEPRTCAAGSELEKAPAWVPGSPTGAHMPDGCVGGDGSHHSDRLCVVGEFATEGTVSVVQTLGTVKQRSLRLLGEKLAERLGQVLGPDVAAEKVTALSKQLRDSVGRVTDTWISANCTAYAIAEVRLADFELVIEGPQLTATERASLVAAADRIIGAP